MINLFFFAIISLFFTPLLAGKNDGKSSTRSECAQLCSKSNICNDRTLRQHCQEHCGQSAVNLEAQCALARGIKPPSQSTSSQDPAIGSSATQLGPTTTPIAPEPSSRSDCQNSPTENAILNKMHNPKTPYNNEDKNYIRILYSQYLASKKFIGDKANTLVKTIPTIIKKEKRHCDYIPLYQAGGTALVFINDFQRTLLKVLNNKQFRTKMKAHDKGREIRVIRQDKESQFSTTKNFLKFQYQFIEQQRKELKKQGILGTYQFDHDPLIAPYLSSVSFSLTDTTPGETAVDFFIRQSNMTLKKELVEKILGEILQPYVNDTSRTLDKYLTLMQEYQDLVSGCMIQFFVHKDLVNEVVYLSKEFGYPINASPMFQAKTFEIIKTYQNSSTTEFQNYLKMNGRLPGFPAIEAAVRANKFQARLLPASPLINDQHLKYFVYYDLKTLPRENKKEVLLKLRELQRKMLDYLTKDLAEYLQQVEGR